MGRRITARPNATHRDGGPALVVLYAEDSLARQVDAWTQARGVRPAALSYARSRSGIRRAVAPARFVIIDATVNNRRACRAFSALVDHRSAETVSVYTATVHDGLELLVRSHGAMLLLGPMGEPQWNGLLERKLGLPAVKRRRIDRHHRPVGTTKRQGTQPPKAGTKRAVAGLRSTMGAKAK